MIMKPNLSSLSNNSFKIQALHMALKIRQGKWQLCGWTRNVAGNVTKCDLVRLKFEAGKMSAQVAWRAGTEYNTSTGATWEGTYSDDGKLQWAEKVDTHEGKFIYTGGFVSPSTIAGSYYWDIKPTAVGTFSFTLLTPAFDPNYTA